MEEKDILTCIVCVLNSNIDQVEKCLINTPRYDLNNQNLITSAASNRFTKPRLDCALQTWACQKEHRKQYPQQDKH